MPAIVSVIIPCYRQARFLADCISSLRAQTYPYWEAVIVDDGSPDNASEAGARAVALDSRVRFVQRPNGGPSAARNTGLRASTGAYIQFLDADDYLPPGKLQRHVAMMEANPGLDLVYGNAWYFDDADPTRRIRQGFGPDPHENWIEARAMQPDPVLYRVIRNNLMPICAPLLRRELVELAGPMNESLRAVEDWEYWIRCASKGARFAFDSSPEGESYIRLHPTSASQNRVFMTDTVVGMRVQTLHYLRDRRARRLTLACIGDGLAMRNAEYRKGIYAQTSAATRGIEERLAIWIAQTAGPHTRLNALLRPLLRRLPWHMRALTAGHPSIEEDIARPL